MRFIFKTALLFFLSFPSIAEQFPLEVQTVRLKQSGSFAVVDAKFTNTSPNDLKSWAVGFELVDNDGNGLAVARGHVMAIASGQSKVTDVLFEGVDASQVGGVRVTLDGVVDTTGRRVDTAYKLLLR